MAIRNNAIVASVVGAILGGVFLIWGNDIRALFSPKGHITKISIVSSLKLDERFVDPTDSGKNISIKRIEPRNSDSYHENDFIYTMIVFNGFKTDANKSANVTVTGRLIREIDNVVCGKEGVIYRKIDNTKIWQTDESVSDIIESAKVNHGLTDDGYLLIDRWQGQGECYDNQRYSLEIELYDNINGKRAKATFPVELLSSTKK